MLKTIMDMQNGLQKRLGYDFEKMSDQERAQFMRDHRGYLADEVAEALYEMPFYKRWKNYDGLSLEEGKQAWDKVRMELIDALHFFVNLLLAAGMSAEDVYKLYLMKNAENHRRQDAGYNADVSYHEQDTAEVTNKASCLVMLDGEVLQSNEFISLFPKKDGGMSVMYHADALALGFAIKVLLREYAECLNKETLDNADEIKELLSILDFVESKVPANA